MTSHKTPPAERRARYRRGRAAEWFASSMLVLKGYRILARRLKTYAGEIDLVAVRKNRVAFVEVKRRPSGIAAESAITDRQRQRVRRAAELWLARNPRYQECDICFDVVFLVPGRWPQHIENGL